MANGTNYPTNPGSPKDLTELIRLIEANGEFARGFAEAVRDANQNDQYAIDCVESWLEPSENELTKYGISASRRGGLSRCTDKSLMLYTKLLEKAPEVFR